MYCEDCKHWQEPKSVDSSLWDLLNILYNKMGTCLKTINGWREGVGTMSDDGWESGIYTGPRFGCVHFEEDSDG